MMDDRYYMQLALEEARKAAELGEIPIGAVLVHEGEVVCRAHNMRETWQSATAHAEVIVIEEACKKSGHEAKRTAGTAAAAAERRLRGLRRAGRCVFGGRDKRLDC